MYFVLVDRYVFSVLFFHSINTKNHKSAKITRLYKPHNGFKLFFQFYFIFISKNNIIIL